MEEPLIDLNDGVPSSYASPAQGNASPSPSSSPVSAPRIFDRYFASSSSPSSSSDDESQPSNSSMEATTRRLDYMIQFLDRKLSTSQSSHNQTSSLPQNHNGTLSRSSASSSLPEFVGRGGGTGIFKLPVRSAVHPNRPPSLEVRPHPLRESQLGSFLRTITATETQLWGGTENGAVQVWEFKEMYGGREETAPFVESVAVGSAVMSMVGDEGSKVVWSGHRDGKIRCWKMGSGSERFKEVLSWVAHRGPVLSMAISCYGALK